MTIFPDCGNTAIDPDDSLASDAPPPSVAVREDFGHLTLKKPLGTGAMGEVWLAYDERLSRSVAIKMLGKRLMHDLGAVTRFLDEARATAQLAHPGIVPVHEVGQLPDGRPFYSMDVIRGQTLTQQIDDLHDHFTPDALHRLVARFRLVCDAVGYAHSRGVVHRDLKPDNVMVGAFGEVLVADWGLVRADQDAAEPVHTERDANQTVGLAGTPRFMSPEQVIGLPIGPPSDVFSLGSILVTILDGEYAFPQVTTHAVLVAVGEADARIPTAGPPALIAIARKALSAEPQDRYPTAAELGEAVGQWLDGALKRTRALAEVQAGESLKARMGELRSSMAELQTRIEVASAAIEPWMPVEDKVAAWRLEAERDALQDELSGLEKRRIEHLEAALSHEPALPEARSLLAEHFRALVVAAERDGDTAAADPHLRQMRRYDDGTHAAFIRGDGTLSLDTVPSGARVTCRPYVMQDRVLVPGEATELGTTPLTDVRLSMGAYELTLEADGHHAAVYPIDLGRGEHWDGGLGEAHPAAPVPLLPLGTLAEDECYVPAGPCWQGASNVSFTAPDRHRVWVEGFILRRFVVTNTEYLAFLNDLHTQGRTEEALAAAPREPARTADEPGVLVYAFDVEAGFSLMVDKDGDSWDPSYPVFLVTWHGAAAFVAWLAAQRDQAFRLPTVVEWEKASRGPSGRDYPWGGPPDPAFFSIRQSRPGRPLPAVVDSFPADCSVYGVRGMAGNQREWCADEGADGAERKLKGGCWFFPALGAHGAGTYSVSPATVGDTIGFRAARDLPSGGLD